jgi:hypothetical protein
MALPAEWTLHDMESALVEELSRLGCGGEFGDDPQPFDAVWVRTLGDYLFAWSRAGYRVYLERSWAGWAEWEVATGGSFDNGVWEISVQCSDDASRAGLDAVLFFHPTALEALYRALQSLPDGCGVRHVWEAVSPLANTL